MSHGNGNGNGIAGGNGNGNGIVAEIGTTGAGPAPCGAVLVCGGGVAGIQASLDLSAAGFAVYLVEESPTIGGTMARLDKTFPTGDCATCIISPKLVECLRDKNIDVITMADVVALEGTAGNFKVEILRRPRSVRADRCTGCGDCWSHCPVRNTPETPPPFLPSEPLAPADAARLDEILARYEGDRGGVMPVLQEVNRAYGYLPRLVLEHLACRWQMRLPEILRVASFYDRFSWQPAGRHVIEVCAGTSCHSRGSRVLRERLEKKLGVEPGQTDPTGRFTLRTVRCLGLCAHSPALKIDGQSFGRVTTDRIEELLEQFP
ncbi:MAG: NAD(P)H-dependent oxidoreductase subunit E [Thermoguttaceae bacterium]|jgi:NADH:ubiquinone oxidoreductase subunit E/NAD-dependent dihydropyrimidine dehydrogenase PreA subunit